MTKKLNNEMKGHKCLDVSGATGNATKEEQVLKMDMRSGDAEMLFNSLRREISKEDGDTITLEDERVYVTNLKKGWEFEFIATHNSYDISYNIGEEPEGDEEFEDGHIAVEEHADFKGIAFDDTEFIFRMCRAALKVCEPYEIQYALHALYKGAVVDGGVY